MLDYVTPETRHTNKFQTYDIEVTMRDGEKRKFTNATYIEESWCVRITTDEEAVRINRNGIESIRMRLSE